MSAHDHQDGDRVVGMTAGPAVDGAGTSWGDGETPDRIVTAGRWTLSLRGAELADIRHGGHPVLRGIRFIVRDHDWRTAENLILDIGDEHPDRLRFAVRSLLDGVPVLQWDADLRLGPELEFVVRGRVLRDFRRNRIGLIVLHAPGLAGRHLEVLHPDGTEQSTAFPSDISAHQPALDVTGYRWRTDGLAAELRLVGDVFEMEDQRNWTDASYKTYSTPLAEPFPVSVGRGDLIEQSLTLSCRSTATAVSGPKPMLIMPSAESLPILQTGAGTAPDDAGAGGSPALRLPIMVELPADEKRWPAVLYRAGRDADGADLDVRIIASDPDQVVAVLDALRGTAICRIAVYDRASSRTTVPLTAALRRTMAAVLPDVEVVAGTRAHFTELNRTIDQFSDHRGGLTFSITPQMHDLSRAQVIESLPMQRPVAEQAVRLAGGRPVHIGPVTLRSRFNAVATTPFVPDDHDPNDHLRGGLVDGYGAQQVPEATDPRQTSAGVAAWTVSSIAALAVPGVSTLTLFEAWGPRGLRAAPSAPPHPAGRVIDWVATAGPLTPVPSITIIDGPAAAIGVLCQRLGTGGSGDRRQLLIGNPGDRAAVLQVSATTTGAPQSLGEEATLAAEPRGVRVTVPPASTVRLVLDC
ncbi:hypothetical protein [Microlunatus soli]|uniref:Uncharacterized protein n=1 Tax=Microlunatus soli TaxID=630515 RepID=A0A1H1MRC9_9ACTN|nr:hypothetical protein [Microlunatus soli]SDR89287.1 hypothetical protein SAMN04489812_0230 [Microlunatus soli]